MELDKTDKTRVLIITYEFGDKIAGGIGRVINGVSSSLSSHVDLDIFLFQLSINSFKWLIRFFEIKDKKIKVRNYRGYYIHILFNLLKREKYTAVHFMHSGRQTMKCIRMIKEHYPEIKVVYSCHSIVRYEMKIRKNDPRAAVYDDIFIDKADHIHLLNNTSLGYFRQTYPDIVLKTPFSIIPNGIEENDFFKTSLNYKMKLNKKINKGKNIIILCLSRWAFGKGLEFFLDSVPVVAEKIQNVRFIIAGKKFISWENNYYHYNKLIEKKIEKSKKHICSLGWLNDVKRNTVFSLADICVMPSLLEYFPYSILEPMIAKIPIVSSRIDSVSELLEENRECLFYEPENPEDLAHKLIRLVQDKEEREFLARNAYAKVKELYNWESIALKYAEMYQSVGNMETQEHRKAG